MRTQEYLRSGKTLADLTSEYAIKVVEHPVDPLVILNYDQIASRPKSHPIIRECRGLVLERDTWRVVARSFSRFFNWGEELEQQAQFDWSNVHCQEKADGCFLYHTPLNVWGGGTVLIGDVVTKGLSPTLVGRDESGKLVPCEVVDRFRNGTKDNWLAIVTDAEVSRGGHGAGHPNELRVTDNHHIHLNGEFQPAIMAKNGDALIAHDYRPSRSVMHMMRSALLGDGSVSESAESYRFADHHVEQHAEYSAAIHGWLGECAIKMGEATSGYGSKMNRSASRCYRSLGELRDEWYPNGDKVVPADLDWMDDFSVAKWVMDDGSLVHSDNQEDRCTISTHGFTKQDVERLADKLRAMYGVSVTPHYSKGWYLRLNHGRDASLLNFWKAIAPHVVPCMRYKLPLAFRDVEYRPYPTGTEDVVCQISRVLSVRKLPLGKDTFPSGRCGFDIGTTSKNYFAKGILVHNSLALLYKYNGTLRVNTRGSFAYGTVMNGLATTWQGLFWSAVIHQETACKLVTEDVTLVFELCSPLNKIVRRYPVPTLYLLTAFIRYAGNDEHLEVSPDTCDTIARLLMVNRPNTYGVSQHSHAVDLIALEPDPTFEGVVVRDRNNERVKIKSLKYVALHHLKGEGDNLFNPKHLLPFILSDTGEDEELLVYFPEVAELFHHLKGEVTQLHARMIADWEKHKDAPTQKDFALAIKNSLSSGFLFEARKRGVHPDVVWKERAVESLERWIKTVPALTRASPVRVADAA